VTLASKFFPSGQKLSCPTRNFRVDRLCPVLARQCGKKKVDMYFLWQTGVHQSNQEIRCWQLCLYLLLGSPCRIPEVPKLLMANILIGVLLLRAGLADGSQRASLPIRSLYGYFGLEMWDNKRYWTQFLLADIMELRRMACFCTSMLLFFGRCRARSKLRRSSIHLVLIGDSLVREKR